MALVNEHRNKDAADVLRKVHQKELSGKYFINTISVKDNYLAEITSTSNLLRTRFKLVTALGNVGSCDEALPLILEGLEWIDAISTALDNIETSNSEEDNTSLVSSMKLTNLDNKSYLLVTKSRCSEDVASMATVAYEAVMVSPHMGFALQHAESVVSIVQNVKSSGLDPEKVKTGWELENDTSQTAKLTFKLQRT